jgi:hypothetical protein
MAAPAFDEVGVRALLEGGDPAINLRWQRVQDAGCKQLARLFVELQTKGWHHKARLARSLARASYGVAWAAPVVRNPRPFYLLLHFCQVKTLDLSGCDVDDEGVTALAQALERDTTVAYAASLSRVCPRRLC